MWSIYFYEKVKMTKLTVKILIWCFYPRGLWFHTSLLLTERDQFTDKVTPELKMWKKSLFSSQNLKQVAVAVHSPESSLILPSYSFHWGSCVAFGVASGTSSPASSDAFVRAVRCCDFNCIGESWLGKAEGEVKAQSKFITAEAVHTELFCMQWKCQPHLGHL